MVDLASRRLVVALVISATMLASLTAPKHTARAQEIGTTPEGDAEARREFEVGREAYDHGAFSEARSHFERAFQLSRRRELLFNIGRAADSEGNPERAISAYSAYLEVFPEAANRDFVRARLEKMRADHAARASAEARPPSAAPLPVEVAQASIAQTSLASPLPGAPRRDDRDSPRSLWRRPWVWSVIGAVVAGGVTAGVLATRDRSPKHAAADEYVPTPGDG